MSFYESFLKEAVETLQLVKDELKNDSVSNIATVTEPLQKLSVVLRHSNLFRSQPLLLPRHQVPTNYPMVFGFTVTSAGCV
jgi:hypothetical protein